MNVSFTNASQNFLVVGFYVCMFNIRQSNSIFHWEKWKFLYVFVNICTKRSIKYFDFAFWHEICAQSHCVWPLKSISIPPKCGLIIIITTNNKYLIFILTMGYMIVAPRPYPSTKTHNFHTPIPHIIGKFYVIIYLYPMGKLIEKIDVPLLKDIPKNIYLNNMDAITHHPLAH